MADVQKNVTIKDETGQKLVGINLCILVFHISLERSKLLQIQDVFRSLKEKKQNLGRLFISPGMSMGVERMKLNGSLHTCLLKRIHMI